MINPSIKFVKNCVNSEANAAPHAPQKGIITELSTILNKAPDKFMIHKYFCLSSASIHTFLTVPIYEKAMYHIKICNTRTDGRYA